MRGAGQTGQVEGGAPGPRSRVPIRAAGAWHAARCGAPFGPPPLLSERGSRDRRVTGDSRTVSSVPVGTEYGSLPAQNTAATSRARHPRRLPARPLGSQAPCGPKPNEAERRDSQPELEL